jgi:hypothetical protein
MLLILAAFAVVSVVTFAVPSTADAWYGYNPYYGEYGYWVKRGYDYPGAPYYPGYGPPYYPGFGPPYTATMSPHYPYPRYMYYQPYRGYAPAYRTANPYYYYDQGVMLR